MHRIVASLSAVLMLAAVTAMAQEKSPQSGHEGMAKASASKSDAAVIAKATSAAPPDIGRNATVMGVGADGKMKELRVGTNGWMCMLDLAGNHLVHAGGCGRRRHCDGCSGDGDITTTGAPLDGSVVTRGQWLMEVAIVAGGPPLQLHFRCFAVWEQERHGPQS